MAVANSTRGVITGVPTPPPFSAADKAAHDLATYVRRVPVPPPFLTPKGSEALGRLLDVVIEDRKATRRATLRATIDRLTMIDSHYMTPAQFDALYRAQGELAQLGGAR